MQVDWHAIIKYIIFLALVITLGYNPNPGI